MKWIIHLFLLLTCTSAPMFGDSAQDAWKRILSKCANAAPLGRNLVYFGPSNDVGPGSVWRIANDHSLRLVWELSDAVPDVSVRDSLLRLNPPATCSGQQPTKWSLSVGFPFLSRLAAGNLSADLSKAKKISVSVDEWRFVELKEGPYKRLLESADFKNRDYKTDLAGHDNIFIETAVQVTGLTTTLEFSSGDSVGLKAKYSTGTVSTGDGGASLQAAWSSDNTLTLKSDKPVYLIANFAQWTGTSISGLEGEPVYSSPVHIKGPVDLGIERTAR